MTLKEFLNLETKNFKNSNYILDNSDKKKSFEEVKSLDVITNKTVLLDDLIILQNSKQFKSNNFINLIKNKNGNKSINNNRKYSSNTKVSNLSNNNTNNNRNNNTSKSSLSLSYMTYNGNRTIYSNNNNSKLLNNSVINKDINSNRSKSRNISSNKTIKNKNHTKSLLKQANESVLNVTNNQNKKTIKAKYIKSPIANIKLNIKDLSNLKTLEDRNLIENGGIKANTSLIKESNNSINDSIITSNVSLYLNKFEETQKNYFNILSPKKGNINNKKSSNLSTLSNLWKNK